MKFIDEAIVRVKAGDGGDGIIAWRKESYVPLGGPCGGNGGNGGNIVLKVNENINSLLDLQYKKVVIAKNGGNGKSKRMNGLKGLDEIILIPIGTQIIDNKNKRFLFDMNQNFQEKIICYGGVGGLGNSKFKSLTGSALHVCTKGLLGDEKILKLNLKLIADVGFFGFPNVGKSTLLSLISSAKPKVGNYPFTTLFPTIGVVKNLKKKIIIIDTPGIVSGSYNGAGVGMSFLKHLERVKIICHLVSLNNSFFLNKNIMINRYLSARNELKKFNKKMSLISEIVVISKDDLCNKNSLTQKKIFESFLLRKNIKHLKLSSIKKYGFNKLIKIFFKFFKI